MSGGGRLQMPGLQVAPKPVVTVVPWDEAPDVNGDFSYDFYCDYAGPVRWFTPEGSTDDPNALFHWNTFTVADGTEVQNGSINVAVATTRQIFAVAEESLGSALIQIPQ